MFFLFTQVLLIPFTLPARIMLAYLNEMNYLAHAYLSFGDPDILAGNMISDFVKGKKKV